MMGGAKKVKINKRFLIVLIALAFTIIFAFTTVVFAGSNPDPVTNPDHYNPTDETASGTNFMKKAGVLLGFLRYLGIIVAVVVLAIIGISYMLSSVEGKAEYKKKILPYVLGCFLIVGISLVLGLVADILK